MATSGSDYASLRKRLDALIADAQARRAAEEQGARVTPSSESIAPAPPTVSPYRRILPEATATSEEFAPGTVEPFGATLGHAVGLDEPEDVLPWAAKQLGLYYGGGLALKGAGATLRAGSKGVKSLRGLLEARQARPSGSGGRGPGAQGGRFLTPRGLAAGGHPAAGKSRPPSFARPPKWPSNLAQRSIANWATRVCFADRWKVLPGLVAENVVAPRLEEGASGAGQPGRRPGRPGQRALDLLERLPACQDHTPAMDLSGWQAGYRRVRKASTGSTS
jgi:hypothetical protein